MTAPIVVPWYVAYWHTTKEALKWLVENVVEHWETIQFLTVMLLLLAVAWMLHAGYRILKR